MFKSHPDKVSPDLVIKKAQQVHNRLNDRIEFNLFFGLMLLSTNLFWTFSKDRFPSGTSMYDKLFSYVFSATCIGGIIGFQGLSYQVPRIEAELIPGDFLLEGNSRFYILLQSTLLSLNFSAVVIYILGCAPFFIDNPPVGAAHATLMLISAWNIRTGSEKKALKKDGQQKRLCEDVGNKLQSALSRAYCESSCLLDYFSFHVTALGLVFKSGRKDVKSLLEICEQHFKNFGVNVIVKNDTLSFPFSTLQHPNFASGDLIMSLQLNDLLRKICSEVRSRSAIKVR